MSSNTRCNKTTPLFLLCTPHNVHCRPIFGYLHNYVYSYLATMASLCIFLRSNCIWYLQSVIWKSSFRRLLAVQHFPGCMKMHELCFSDFYILLTITNCVESCRVAIDCFKFVFQGGTVLLHLTHYWHH